MQEDLSDYTALRAALIFLLHVLIWHGAIRDGETG
jgi:hypothetical protein